MMVVKETQFKTKLMFKFPQKATITIGARVYLEKKKFCQWHASKTKGRDRKREGHKSPFLVFRTPLSAGAR